MYTTNPSGIACDKVRIQHDGSIHCINDVYLLRPEVVESVFYAWRETHDQKWRDYARDIWRAIAKHCQVDSGGFTDVRHVTSDTPTKMDKQESWFLAETLKYLWLTFQPDSIIPLDKYVFNTEAHPIKVF
jgi:mannosyl-oligosaccharide alpha-1,2-mannosidase